MTQALGLVLGLSAGLGGSLSTRNAEASEPDLFGAGTRAPALGGTGASFSDDYEAVYENPAGLAAVRSRRLVVGFVAARDSLVLDGRERAVDPTNGFFIGAQLPIPFGGALRDRVALGLLIYLPVGVVNRAKNPFPTEAALPLLDNRTQTVSVMLAAGARLHRRLSIGGGALALAALTGVIDLGTDGTGHFVSRSNEQLVASYAPIVGAQVDAGAGVALGLVFRGESVARYDIAVRSDLSSVLKLFSLPTLRIAGLAQYDPMQLAFEASYRPAPAFLLAVGLGWAHWSAFPVAAEWVTPPPAGTPVPPPPGFHDTVVPRFGLEWTTASGPLRTTLRGGYFYAQSPAPSGPDRVAVDADRHAASFGLALYYENRFAPLHLDGFAQVHALAASARASGSLAVVGASLGVDL